MGFTRVSGLVAACCLTAVLDVVERFRFDSSSFCVDLGACADFGAGVDFGTGASVGAGVGFSSGSTMGAGRRCAVLRSNSTMERKQNVRRNIEILLGR